MAGNVLSWPSALRMGYEPWLYSYMAGDIPTGEFKAVLDFKIWAKKVMGINCYFTQAGTGKKFPLTVYPSATTKAYKAGSNRINFYDCPTSQL
ncbi:MAG: hypothetical protein WDO19_14745 [Bacteroidota bacterium]